jgi:DNA-binding HxlR family transcriptional regulator
MTTAAARVEPTEYEMVAGTRSVLALLAGKWTVEILYLLAGGRRRYSEVYYEVGEISKKVLTRTLRTLERHGLVARTVHAEVPPRVEYSLTPLGWSLTEPLMTIYEWSAENLSPAAQVSEPDAKGPELRLVHGSRLAA